jgi:beta-phosphoglucomutase-like phosphatase (HAD superfamily)
MTAALLFDLDGTIVDSDPEHLRAFQTVFAGLGIALDRDNYVRGIMGASNDIIGERYLPHLSKAERNEAIEKKEQLYRDGLGDMSPIAGFLAFLDFAEGERFKTALVTNAPRANVDQVLKALSLSGRLPLRIIGAELARAKPDPLPYLTALEKLGADPKRSVAFEDSLSGLRSALGADLAVVGIASGLPPETLLGAGASLAVADFNDARIRPFIAARAQA